MKPNLLCSASLLAMGLSAQEPAKVAAPLPRVDVDAKFAAPSPTASSTAPKTTTSAPMPLHSNPEPKASERAALPNGKSVTLMKPTEPVFGSAAGVIDVLGSTYKAYADSGVFTYVPYFGADAPRNFPIQLRLTGVEMGGVAAPLSAPSAARSGRRITLAHGGCDEIYDIAREQVEQKFVITTPFAGDLTIRIAVTTDLQPERATDGWRFVGAHGAVGYTDAVLVDAHGTRLPMRTDYVGGTLTLQAAASAIARAAFPITVDPVLSTYTAATNTSYVYLNPDVAYAASAQNYLVVWTRQYSASDYDLHAVAVDRAGNTVPNSFTLLDNSGDKWDQGKVASCGGNFLAVASRVPAAGGQREIWGVTRAVGSTTTGAQFQISDNSIGDKNFPDVGGEFWGPTNFCVVWQRTFRIGDNDIHYRMVSSNGALNGAVGLIDNSSSNNDFAPSIANCDGDGPSSMQFWPVTWHRYVNGQPDVWGARVRWDGQLATTPFAIDSAATDSDLNPCPSSLTADIGGTRYWLVTYATDNPGNWDVFVRVFADGATPTLRTSGFLSTIEGLSSTARARAQWAPRVDSDGCRFAISYLEDYSPTDYDVYLTTLQLGSSLIAVDARATITTSTWSSNSLGITAERSGGGQSLDFNVAYDLNSATSTINSTIEGRIYRGIRTGGFSTRATGCGGITITSANGSPVPGPGREVRFDVSGGLGASVIVFGTPTDMALCAPSPCRLGATTTVILPAASLAFTIPNQASVLRSVLAVQGVGLTTSGGCANLGQVATSDTIDITVQ